MFFFSYRRCCCLRCALKAALLSSCICRRKLITLSERFLKREWCGLGMWGINEKVISQRSIAFFSFSFSKVQSTGWNQITFWTLAEQHKQKSVTWHVLTALQVGTQSLSKVGFVYFSVRGLPVAGRACLWCGGGLTRSVAQTSSVKRSFGEKTLLLEPQHINAAMTLFWPFPGFPRRSPPSLMTYGRWSYFFFFAEQMPLLASQQRWIWTRLQHSSVPLKREQMPRTCGINKTSFCA